MPAPIGPHANERVVHTGAPLESAGAVMIMLHGRGASPESILEFARPIDRPRVAFVAPAASGGAWYPYSFLAPRDQNEPGITSALSTIESLVSGFLQQGFPPSRIVLLGFSQGACLSAEFSVRHPRRYGGVLVLSGGLIGPAGTRWDDVRADLHGVPVFLGCSDIDPHIPKARVVETEAVFKRIGATVKQTLYKGMGHVVNADELTEVQRVLDTVLTTAE